LWIDLGADYTLDSLSYLPRQNSPNGRIRSYQIYVGATTSAWTQVAAGTFATNASEQTVPFTPTAGRYLRIVTLSSQANKPWASIAEINLTGISAGNVPPNGVIDTPTGDVTISAGSSVEFTGTGTDPDANLPLTFLWDFGDPAIADATVEDPGSVVFPNPGTYTVTFTVTDALGATDATPDTIVVTVTSNSSLLSQAEWSVEFVDSEELVGENAPASNAFDGDPATYWHTEWLPVVDPGHPHELWIDLGADYTLDSLSYLPRQNSPNGRIRSYQIYVGATTSAWTQVAAGTFATNASEQTVLFTPTAGRYLRIVTLSSQANRPWASIAEINLTGVPTG
jgi:hypothetical protein